MEDNPIPYELLKPWQRFIMYSFMSVITIAFIIVIVFGSAKFGLMLWLEYKEFGWLGLGVFVIGLIAMGLLWITINLSMAIVKRITKWKWLQIPME